MNKILSAVIIMLFVSSAAIASVNVLSDGTNLGPAQDINVTGGTVSGTGPIKTLALGTAKVTSGTINGAVIGGVTPAAGTFTTVGATTGNITTVNATTVDVATRLDMASAQINWTDMTAVGTPSINWTTAGVLETADMVGAGINWTAVLSADAGINWADLTGL